MTDGDSQAEHGDGAAGDSGDGAEGDGENGADASVDGGAAGSGATGHAEGETAAPDGGAREPSTPAPDEAFAALGNETRMGVLRTLGEADEPLSFSELHDRSEMRDSGQFNYHLDKLVGHFVRKTGDGYALARPGRRVVEAVLSGAVTDAPELSRTRVDDACEYCGAPIEIRWRDGGIEVFCSECAGTYGDNYRPQLREEGVPEGFLGRLSIPPAGLQGRTASEALRAAWTWGNLEMLAMSAGICPRCSAPVEHDPLVCEDHDAEEGLCPSCRRRHAVAVGVFCTNCIFDTAGPASLAVVAHTDLIDLETDHDLNPVAPRSIRGINRVHEHYEETVRSTDPFEARFTFAVGDDGLAMTVDDDLRVVETDRTDADR